MSVITNKIEAHDKNIESLLKDQKFFIDYFQREYRWQNKHIQVLIEDLTTAFLHSYNSSHKRSEVANYQTYYLGPVVLNSDSESGHKSIIDGQQRITSLTLLLIYLNHLQTKSDQCVSIDNLIFSEKYGEKSFNIFDEEREECLNALYKDGEYTIKEDDNETVRNMQERYSDIGILFPEDEIDTYALPYFIDWLLNNVIVVEITAYSDENAYTIFETMNDRGLNLSPSEMLKGFILSRITDSKQRNEANAKWKNNMQKLHDLGKDADQTFFQAFLRGKYAEKIRPGQAGSENQDFELIGTRFHNWVKDNCELLKLNDSNDFYSFATAIIPFYIEIYLKIYRAYSKYNEELNNLFYIGKWGIADSLQEPILLSSILITDTEDIQNKKLNLAAKYIETFTVRRSVNFKKFAQTSIKYTMFGIMKLFRDSTFDQLNSNVATSINSIEQKFDGIQDFRLHGMNKYFVKHLLSRITGYIDSVIGRPSNYESYFCPKGKPFEIEHIWGDKFEEHLDEFEQESDFETWRNSIGAMILLPNGINQSYGSDEYKVKVEHYLKENAFAQSLNKNFYEKNPNFLKSEIIQQLQFTPHSDFKKKDIQSRKDLVQRICEKIWE